MNKWYIEPGPKSDVAVSSRIRLARNISRFPFPDRLSPAEKKKVNALVKNAVIDGNSVISKDFSYIEMENISEAKAYAMAERHIISPGFAENKEGRALLLLKDESVSIMLNEEDHIRIQVLSQGLSLENALELADKIDTLLDEKLSYCFDEKIGFLTQCPTNLGTGLRASVMLHLPALEQKGVIPNLQSTLSKIGLTIRGTYGEGSSPQGSFYQISNQVTLGISEENVVKNLNALCLQVIEQERAFRSALKNSELWADKCYRSYGILENARILNSAEFMELISLVRVGIVTGLIENFSLKSLNKLIIDAQGASIIEKEGKNLSAAERDIIRARLAREAIQHDKQR